MVGLVFKEQRPGRPILELPVEWKPEFYPKNFETK